MLQYLYLFGEKYWIRLNNLIETEERYSSGRKLLKYLEKKTERNLTDSIWNEIQYAMVTVAFSIMLTVTSAQGTFSRQAKAGEHFFLAIKNSQDSWSTPSECTNEVMRNLKTQKR